MAKKLFQVLQYRNDELIARTNETIQQTSESIHETTVAMRRLSAKSSAESGIIATLTEEGRRDSRSMKILTFVAMLYLPATLLAVRHFNSLTFH